MPPQVGPEIILAEWLFVETVDDVRRRCQDSGTRTRYELLGIAPLLRKLILDKHPLVNTVKAVRQEVPTEFRIKEWRAPGDDSADDRFPYVLRLGGPELVGGPNDHAFPKLKQFIGASVGVVQDKPLTVRDVVRYYANAEGGVHFGHPEDDAQRVLSSMAPLLLGHSTGQIEILAHIGTVVVDALTPLRDSILAAPMIDKRMHRRNERGFYDGHWTADYQTKHHE